ncbi:hypothetical protein KA005_84525 [bacterium]|nr:hypothetical protein [bacterium]
MEDIQYEALREFKYLADRSDPEYIFESQKNAISFLKRETKRYRKKFKNPVHWATGKPLKENTLKQYKAYLADLERYVAGIEVAIEMLKKYGILGDGRKSINEVLALYSGELSEEDKPWIEILREIKNTHNERKAYREKIIHRIKTCPEECPLKDLFEHLSYG